MERYPGDMTPLELAKYLVRRDVEHYTSMGEDPIPPIMRGWHGMCGPRYAASVGGWIRCKEAHDLLGSDDPQKYDKLKEYGSTRVSNSKILVEEAQDVLVNQVFPLAEIVRMVQTEARQLSLV